MEDRNAVVKFEMSSLNKFAIYKLPLILLCGCVGMFIFFVIYGMVAKYSLIDTLEGICVLPYVLFILYLIGIWRYKRSRFANELSINQEKKEFHFYFRDTKEELRLTVKDIVEVNGSQEMFRFFLKDGTWVSWAKDNATHQFLGEVINSFGISIKDKVLW